MLHRTTCYLVALGLMTMVAEACIHGGDVPAKGAISITPDFVGFRMNATQIHRDELVKIESVGAIPVTITSVEVDVSDAQTGSTGLVTKEDTPNSCLHPFSPTSPGALRSRVLKPGETCEVFIKAVGLAGTGELRVWSDANLLGSIKVNIIPN